MLDQRLPGLRAERVAVEPPFQRRAPPQVLSRFHGESGAAHGFLNVLAGPPAPPQRLPQGHRRLPPRPIDRVVEGDDLGDEQPPVWGEHPADLAQHDIRDVKVVNGLTADHNRRRLRGKREAVGVADHRGGLRHVVHQHGMRQVQADVGPQSRHEGPAYPCHRTSARAYLQCDAGLLSEKADDRHQRQPVIHPVTVLGVTVRPAVEMGGDLAK